MQINTVVFQIFTLISDNKTELLAHKINYANQCIFHQTLYLINIRRRTIFDNTNSPGIVRLAEPGMPAINFAICNERER